MNNTSPTDTAHIDGPHVDTEWRDAFILEMRLLDVPGPHIGSALADVETHCADSGETATDAFGDPVAYARSLDVPHNATTFTAVEIGAMLAGLVGMFVTVFSFGAWFSGEDTPLTWGALGALALVIGSLGVLLAQPQRVMRAVVTRPWLLIAAQFVLIGGSVALLFLLDQPLLKLPSPLTAAVGIALVTAHTVHAVRQQAAGLLDDDVVGPGGPDAAGAVPVSRGMRRLSRLNPWVTAIGTAVLSLASVPLLFL